MIFLRKCKLRLGIHLRDHLPWLHNLAPVVAMLTRSALQKGRRIVLFVLVQYEVVDIEAEIEFGDVTLLSKALERDRLVIKLPVKN